MSNDCERLRAQNRRLAWQNRQLRQKLNRVARYTGQVHRQAGAVLSQRSGVPRHKWIRAKAAYEVSGSILRMVQHDN